MSAFEILYPCRDWGSHMLHMGRRPKRQYIASTLHSYLWWRLLDYRWWPCIGDQTHIKSGTKTGPRSGVPGLDIVQGMLEHNKLLLGTVRERGIGWHEMNPHYQLPQEAAVIYSLAEADPTKRYIFLLLYVLIAPSKNLYHHCLWSSDPLNHSSHFWTLTLRRILQRCLPRRPCSQSCYLRLCRWLRQFPVRLSLHHWYAP